jgi:hypothetical protein
VAGQFHAVRTLPRRPLGVPALSGSFTRSGHNSNRRSIVSSLLFRYCYARTTRSTPGFLPTHDQESGMSNMKTRQP